MTLLACRHQDDAVGFEPAVARLDVEELFHTNVRTKASLQVPTQAVSVLPAQMLKTQPFQSPHMGPFPEQAAALRHTNMHGQCRSCVLRLGGHPMWESAVQPTQGSWRFEGAWCLTCCQSHQERLEGRRGARDF